MRLWLMRHSGWEKPFLISELHDYQLMETLHASHEVAFLSPGNDKINSDIPYGERKKPGISSTSNMDMVEEQDNLPDERERSESASNSGHRGQVAGRTEKPKRPIQGTVDKDDPPILGKDTDNSTSDEKNTKRNLQSNADKTNGWVTVYDEHKKIDEDWVQQTDKYIDTLLVFAGLFSAVLTTFLAQVYTELQPDNTQISTSILLDLSNQLQALSLGQVAPTSNISFISPDPTESLVAITSLWFVSLILSLAAALFSILVKQWIREYMRWTTVFPLQHAIHIRYYRNRDLKDWNVEGTITIVSECLQISLVLFFIGLAILLWRTNRTTAYITTAFVGLVLLAAIITTALPVFILSCPYRTTFASLLRNIPVFLRRVLFYAWVVVDSVRYSFSPIQDPWWIAIPNDFLSNWRHEVRRISKDPRNTQSLLFKTWIKSDKLSRLPQDSYQSTIDRFVSLHWLTSHRVVPDDLVAHCLVDLPGTPITLPKHEWDSGWTAKNEREHQRQRFEVHCQALLSLILSEDLYADQKEITILEKLLAAKLPDRTENADQISLPQAYKNIIFDDLLRATRRADEQSRGVLSTYFFSLAERLLNSEQFLSCDADFDLVKNLLRILILLWYDSDYHWTQRRGDGYNTQIDTDADPAIKSFRYLREVLNKLSAQSLQAMNYDSRACCNSIFALLGNFSFIYALLHTSSKDDDFRNVMRVAQNFVEYNREKLSPSDDSGLSEDGRQSNIRRFTRVFWNMAISVFQPDVHKNPNISAADRQAFLTAVQTMLQTSVDASDTLSSWDARYFVPYVIQHRCHLPSTFISTLREADDKGIINISDMLSNLDRLSSSHDITKGIQTLEAFWRAMENPDDPIVPNPGS